MVISCCKELLGNTANVIIVVNEPYRNSAERLDIGSDTGNKVQFTANTIHATLQHARLPRLHPLDRGNTYELRTVQPKQLRLAQTTYVLNTAVQVTAE